MKSSDEGDATIRCGDIIAFYHCDEQRHLAAEWEPHSPQDDVRFLEQHSDRASPNALWMIQTPNGLHLSDTVKQEQGYCLQHLASGNYLCVTDAKDTVFAAPDKPPPGEDETPKQSMGGLLEVAAAAAEAADKDDDPLARPRSGEGKVAAEPEKKVGFGLPGAVGGIFKKAAGKEKADGGGASGAGSRGTIDLKNSHTVLCVRPPTPDRAPDLFELHDSHSTAKGLRASSLIRLKHKASGGWVTAITYTKQGGVTTGGASSSSSSSSSAFSSSPPVTIGARRLRTATHPLNLAAAAPCAIAPSRTCESSRANEDAFFSASIEQSSAASIAALSRET